MRRRKNIRLSVSDRVFTCLNWLALTVFLLVIAYPLLFVVTASFSGGTVVMRLSPIPARWSIAGYRTVFAYKDIWTGYRNSLLYMSSGTLVSLCLTVCCAYPLSRKDLRMGKYVMALGVFTMYFTGGLIPTYLLVRDLGLLNSFWALILPGSMSVYNMIVMRTYFHSQIPGELLDSAQMDGCGDLLFLWRIVLPLSVPILAVLGLFYAVNYWNSYFDALIYLNDRSKFSLQVILREILVANSADPSTMSSIEMEQVMDMESRRNVMKYAVIMVASLPVMMIYPFVQRYFVKGMMIGAIKG